MQETVYGELITNTEWRLLITTINYMVTHQASKYKINEHVFFN